MSSASENGTTAAYDGKISTRHILTATLSSPDVPSFSAVLFPTLRDAKSKVAKLISRRSFAMCRNWEPTVLKFSSPPVCQ